MAANSWLRVAHREGTVGSDDQSEPLFAHERLRFHAGLLAGGTLAVNAAGVASNADSSSKASKAYALHIAQALKSETVSERIAGQIAGSQFEQACADFLTATFHRLGHLRPGHWSIHKVSGHGQASGVAQYEQYAHLVDLSAAIKANPSLRTVLGNGYAIAPDVVVTRAPVSDEEINARIQLVDATVANRTALRAVNHGHLLLHAVISCKWTLRSDRAQNARSEALNLIRNRKGRLPHIAVVTAEPTPARISSLALGTGDIDCVYHFALPELVAAVQADGGGDTAELLDTMIEGNRLKDIADLPLDLAV